MSFLDLGPILFIDEDLTFFSLFQQPILKSFMCALSLGTCKSCKQTRACALVCLPDLQLPLEIFPVYFTKGGLISVYYMKSSEIQENIDEI